MSAALEASFTPDQLCQGWQPKRIGRNMLILAETTSTNRMALDRASEPGADGLAVLTDYQTTGRGRQGREWLSPRGAGVLCSILLRVDESPDGTPDRFGGWLTLASAVASCEAIRHATDIVPSIKWPNDLRVAGRKLGGILIESRVVGQGCRAWVVGIGLNCLQQAGHFPPELRSAATSLDMESNYPVDRVAIARELLRHLDIWLAASPSAGDNRVHQTWLSYAEPIGQYVRLRREGRDYAGRTIEVDPACGLIVQCDDGTLTWFDPMLTTIL